MANSVSRYTGIDPNGDTSVMAALEVVSAGLFALAGIARVQLYVKALDKG